MTDPVRSERRTLRDMVVSGSGSLMAPLVTFISIPIIARLYSPAEVGVWALLVSLAMIVGPVSTLRFELAAVLEDDDRDAGRILTLCLVGVLATAALAWVVLTLVLPLIESSNWGVSLKHRLWVVPVLILATGIKVTADGWSVRARAFSLRAVSLVALAAGTNGGQIALWYGGVRGVDGLVYGSVLGAVLSALILMVPLVWMEGWRLRPFTNWRGMGSLVSKHRRFPVYTASYTLLGSLRREGVKLMVGAWGTQAMVGSVAFSWRLTNFPAQMFSNGIRPVLFERAARAEHLRDVMPFVRRLQLGLGAAALPVLLVVEIWTEPIFGFVLGEEWLPAVPYARLLMVPATVFICTNWLDRLFDVAGRQDLSFRLELVFSTLSLGGLATGLWGFDSSLVGVGIMSGVLTLYYLILAVAASRLTHQTSEGGVAE
jgi:O-antigen/teichoic acid export membrane protein